MHHRVKRHQRGTHITTVVSDSIESILSSLRVRKVAVSAPTKPYVLRVALLSLSKSTLYSPSTEYLLSFRHQGTRIYAAPEARSVSVQERCRRVPSVPFGSFRL